MLPDGYPGASIDRQNRRFQAGAVAGLTPVVLALIIGVTRINGLRETSEQLCIHCCHSPLLFRNSMKSAISPNAVNVDFGRQCTKTLRPNISTAALGRYGVSFSAPAYTAPAG